MKPTTYGMRNLIWLIALGAVLYQLLGDVKQVIS